MAKLKERVFAVFGLGNFGSTIAETLTKQGGTVIAVDSAPAAIDEIKNKVSTALLLDSTDERAMSKAPLDDVDTAVIAIDDMETSIITTVLLKKRGIPYILCRSSSAIHTQVLKQIGANEVLNLQKDEGQRIASRLISNEILDTVPITAESSMAEVYVPDMFFGKHVSDMALDSKFNLHFVGIKRINVSVDSVGNPVRNEDLIFADSGYEMQPNDMLILIGKNYDIDQLKASF